MLKKALLVVCLAVLVTTGAVASAGCASSGGLTSMLARVPADTASLKYLNVKALRNDIDLEDLYDAWKSSAGSRLEAHGIISSEVSAFAASAGTGKRFTLLVGNFDLDGLREELDDRHYDQEEYRGVEVWEREVGWLSDLESRVALMGTLIVLGNEAGVESCIKVIKAGDASWLSKVDMNDVASRLPGGLYVELATQWTGLLAKGFEAYGISAKKQDSDTLKIAGVAKFNDEDDADDAEDAIEDMMDQRFDSVEVSQEGIFLEGRAELDIDDAAPLF